MERRWWTLIVVCVAAFMLLLDITVVNVALPSIERDLGASFTDLQWVIDAYALTLAAFVLTAGSIADRIGRKRVFIAGLGLFSLASLACGLAGSPLMLNLGRALQGVGGSIMFAVSLALVAQEFEPGRARGTAMGIFGATIGAAVAIGPLVGGALTDAIGWESIFWVNVPIGLGAMAIALAVVHESRDENATRIDWLGQITFIAALACLVLALLRGNAEGWGSPAILALLGAAAALTVAFAIIELHVAEPMLPLRLFRISAFTGIQLGGFTISAALFSMFLYITYYLQNYLGYSPLEAGLQNLPISILSFLGAIVSGRLIGRVQGRHVLAGGLTMVGVSLLLMRGIEVDSGWTTLLAGFLCAGIGAGLINPVLANGAVTVVPRGSSGMGSGINNTFRQVGIAVGTAVWGAIFVATGSSRISEVASGSALGGAHPRELIEAASSGGLERTLAALPAGVRGPVEAATREGFVAGLNEILLFAALLALAGAAATLLLVREEQIHPAPAPAPAEPGSAEA